MDAVIPRPGPRYHTVYELFFDDERTEIPSWTVQLFIPVFFCTGVLSLLPPPGPMRVIIGLTAFTTMWWYTVTHWSGDGSFMMGPMFAFPITLRWAFMVLRGTPETDYFPLQAREKKVTSPLDLTTLRKLKWSMDLWCSWRGVGWNWEFPGLRKSSSGSTSHLRFVLAQICWVAANLAAAQLITRFSFCPLYPSSNTVEAFLLAPLWQQYAISAAQLVLSTRFLDSTYRIFAIIAVSLGLSAPESNPPCFGSLADAYSVRQFWGKYWHQMFRKVFNAAGEMAAQAVGAEKGTLLSRYLKTYTGYITSGAMHAVPGLFVRHSSPLWSLTNLLHMPFYAVIVTVEDVLKACGRRLGIRDSALIRIVGYVWTAFWVPFIYRYAFVFYIDIGFCDGVCPS